MINLFIGYIFIFFHIKINGIDLLADFIGYILIYRGLCALSDEAEAFRKAKPWTLAMVIVEIVRFADNFIGILPSSTGLIILNLITIIISLYIMYLISTGIYQTEQRNGLELNSGKILTVWKFQAVFTIAGVALAWIVLLASLSAVAGMITNIVFLVYLYKAAKIFENSKTQI